MLVVLLKIHVASRSLAVRLLKHRAVPGRASSGARTGIGRIVRGFLKAPVACPISTATGRFKI